MTDNLNRAADEPTTLVEMLDFYRGVMLNKADGLTDTQLSHAHPPSDLTIGGLLMHLALVEDSWFDDKFAGRPELEPWASIPWDDDHDWEFHHAHERTGDDLRNLYNESVARSQATISAAIASPTGLDTESVRRRDLDDKPWNLRWIMVHMIEEYARHCGHADYIRQSIDGVTGD